MKFELDEAQVAKFTAWAKEQAAKKTNRDATGFRYSFNFMPSGLGPTINVVDLLLNETLDLTDYDNI